MQVIIELQRDLPAEHQYSIIDMDNPSCCQRSEVSEETLRLLSFPECTGMAGCPSPSAREAQASGELNRCHLRFKAQHDV